MRIREAMNSKNWLYYFIGSIILPLNYTRHSLFGYRTPRDFSINQISRSLDYDFSITESLDSCISGYTQQSCFLKDKVVLELGPGPDLGIGLILLADGIKKYIAFDINRLITARPLEFYKGLFRRIKDRYPTCDIDFLKEELKKCFKEKSKTLSYIVDKNFTVSKIKDKVDLVFSHAAFEHFDDIERTIKGLNETVNSDGILIANIDLTTHTRWIKDIDPLNIYRYSDFYWNLFRFKGSPNRIRTFEYKKFLETNGWFDIRIIPKNILKDEYLYSTNPALYKRFKKMDPSEMKILNFILMARKR